MASAALARPSLKTATSVATPILGLSQGGRLAPLDGYEIGTGHVRACLSPLDPPVVHTIVEDVLAADTRRVVVPGLLSCVADIGLERALQDIPDAFVGQVPVCVTVPPRDGQPRTRYLDAGVAWGITSGEFTRCYLRRVANAGRAEHPPDPDDMTSKCVAGWRTRDLAFYKIPAAFFYKPGPDEGRWIGGDWAVLDLSAAYWMVGGIATLDPRYRPGRYFGYGTMPVWDHADLTRYKAFRLAFYGHLRQPAITRVRHGTVQPPPRAMRSPFMSPSNVGYTLHTIHAVMHDLITRYHAVAVSTDAAIIPAHLADHAIDHTQDAWHLQLHIAAIGAGAIYGHNRHQIGSKRTKHAPPRPTLNLDNYPHITQPYPVNTLDPAATANTGHLQRTRAWLLGSPTTRAGLHDALSNADAELEALTPHTRHFTHQHTSPGIGQSPTGEQARIRGLFVPAGDCTHSIPEKNTRHCHHCGTPLHHPGQGTPPKYCGRRCKNAAYKAQSHT